MKRLRLAALAVASAAALSTLAHAAGMFEGHPLSAPNTAGSSGITGNEVIPADTRLSGGVNPQTMLIPLGTIAPGAVYQGATTTYKNLLRGGDISANPAQLGSSQAADIANTITTSIDGFRMLGGASSAINWSTQTGASDIVAGQFTKSLRFQRKAANANTAQICQINVLSSQDSVALQGRQFVYSFWAKAGANISPTNGQINVTVASGTGTDQSAATFNAGTWTGQANAITAAASSNTSFPAMVSSCVCQLQTLPSGATATWVQYWVSGTIPSTATQVGTQICMTPVGTAGANDWVETSNHQLEITFGTSSVTPTGFEHISPAQSLRDAQRYLTVLAEGASGVQSPVVGTATAATTAAMVYKFPTTMRVAPTFAAAGTALSGTTWTNKCGAVNNALASTFIVTATANSTEGASMTVTSSGATAGFGCILTGAGGGSLLTWSAEL